MVISTTESGFTQSYNLLLFFPKMGHHSSVNAASKPTDPIGW